MANLSSLSDDFNDNSKDTGLWASTATLLGPLAFASLGGSVSETNNQVEVATPASADGANGYTSLATDFTTSGGYAYIKVTPPSTNPVTTPGQGHLIVVHDVTDVNGLPHYASFNLHLSRFGAPITLSAFYNNSGSAGTTVTVDYDPVDHLWWRIRFTGTDIIWETSPDGSTWTEFRKISDDPGLFFDFTVATVGFFAEADNDAQSAHTWAFDNFNTDGGPPPPAPRIIFPVAAVTMR